MFSLYKNSYDNRGVRTISLDQVYEGIRSGAHGLAEKTQNANRLVHGDKQVYKDYKESQFPAVTFGGTFKPGVRKGDGLIQHSGYVILDWDGFADLEAISEVIIVLREHPKIVLLFLSPSALGLKVLMRVDPIPRDKEEHKDAWRACRDVALELQEKHGWDFKFDPSGSDVNRLCYLPHDPLAIYLPNADPVPWEPTPEPEKKQFDANERTFQRAYTSEHARLLEYIPCGVDLRAGKDVIPSYDVWIQVGMALKEIGAPVEIWDEWSQTDKRPGQYKMGVCAEKWETFNPDDDAKKVGWTRLVEYAKWNGYVPRSSQNFVSDTPKSIPEEQIDMDTSDSDMPVFPEELFEGIFAHYRDALDEANPTPDSYLFASLKQAICASLGRSVFIDSDPLVYPVLFTGLIGESSSAHKGIALTMMSKLLRQSDPNVLQMPALTTEEGLIDMFIQPELVKRKDDDGEDTEVYVGGWYPYINNFDRATEIMGQQMSHESIRIFCRFAELSQVLQRGKKNYASGLIEQLMDLYDAPQVIISPNKHAKARAEYPTFGMIGASTFNLIENALDTNYIAGGLTNRFEWYYGEEKRDMFTFKKPKSEPWNKTVEELSAIRDRYVSPTGYEMTPEADEMGVEWLKVFKEQIKALDHDFVVDSLKRQKILIMKNALVFAVLRNEEKRIEPVDIVKAITLAEYTCNVVGQLFANFHNSETKRVVNRIVSLLKKKPHQSLKAIYNQMQWAEIKDVEESIQRLVRIGIIGQEKPKRTTLYVVLKDLVE